MNSTGIICTLCHRQITPAKENYSHRGACGHHLCWPCALPMIVGGKGYCTLCPMPSVDPQTQLLGNLVLGADTEQNKRAAASLRSGLKVSALEPYESRKRGGA